MSALPAPFFGAPVPAVTDAAPSTVRMFSAREIAFYLGMEIRPVRARFVRDGIKTYPRIVKGGTELRVMLADLPKEWRDELVRKIPDLQPTLTNLLATVAREALSMPAWQRAIVAGWASVFQATWGMRENELRRKLFELEKEHPTLSLSYPTYRRKLAAFKEKGVEGLAPGWGATRGKSKIPFEHFRAFEAYYLVEGSPSIRQAHKLAYGEALRENPTLTMAEFGTHHSFKRMLNRNHSPSVQCFYREGDQIWNRKFGSHIDRNPVSVMVGENWVADHHQLDVGCNWDFITSMIPGVDGEIKTLLTQKRGMPKTVFPWITVWRDFRSGKILSCLLHDDSPNSDHVIYSFYLACRRFGVPKSILLDNGKDFRANAFSGGRKNSKGADMSERDRSICRLLGVMVHYAIPYNAKAKPIERDFRKFKEWFAMYLPGYRGGHSKERPERLEGEIKSGALYGHEELAAALFMFVEQVLNKFPSEGKYLRGMSPDEFWDTNPKAVRHVEPDELSLCCMRATDPRQIRGRGVHVANLKLDYYADWMSTQGGRLVYLRLDLLHFSEAIVFDAETDICLGRAQANVWQSDAFVQDEAASSRLRALQRMQGQQLKDLKSLGTSLGLGVEHLDPIGDGARALAELGRARGYTPAEGAPIALPAPAAKTALSAAVEVDRKSRKKDAQKKLKGPLDNPVQSAPKKQYKLFDFDSVQDSVGMDAPEIDRAAG